MSDWPSRARLRVEAVNTANLLCDFWEGIIGKAIDPEGESLPRTLIVESFEGHADSFAVIDPAQVADNFAQLQNIADQLNVALDDNADPGNDSLEADFANLQKYLISWRGKAAERVFDQIANIRVFYNQQQALTINALKVLSALMAVAVKVRDDYLDLLYATQAAIHQAAEAAGEEAGNQWIVHILDEGVSAVIDGITKATLLKKGIDVLLGIAEDVISGTEKQHVEGVTASDIAGAYNRSRDLLTRKYEYNLQGVDKLVKGFESDLDSKKSSLLLPLPLNTNIDSPDFSYNRFFLPSRPPKEFGDNVDRAHREHLKRNKKGSGFTDSDGPISRALDGE